MTDAELPDESGFGRVLPSVLHGPVVLELAAGIYPVDDSGLSAIAGTYEDDGQVVELSANSALVAAPEIDTKVFNDRGVSWLNYEPGWLGNLQVEVAAAALRGTLTIEISRERFASLPHYFFGGADDPLLATRRSIMLKWQPQQMGEDNRALLFEACDLGQQADIPIHVELADERGEIELIVRRLGRQLDMRASSVLQVRSAKGRIDAELFEQNDQDNLFGAYLWLPPRFPSFVIALRDATDVIDALDDTPCFVVLDGQVYTLGDVGSHLGRLYDCLEQPIGEVEVSSVQWPPGLGYANLAEAGMNGAR